MFVFSFGGENDVVSGGCCAHTFLVRDSQTFSLKSSDNCASSDFVDPTITVLINLPTSGPSKPAYMRGMELFGGFHMPTSYWRSLFIAKTPSKASRRVPLVTPFLEVFEEFPDACKATKPTLCWERFLSHHFLHPALYGLYFRSSFANEYKI